MRGGDAAIRRRWQEWVEMTNFNVMMIAVDLGSQQIGMTE